MTLTATTTEQRAIATTRLNRYISEGQARSVSVHARLMNEIPKDHIARANVISFGEKEPGKFEMMVTRPGSQGVIHGPLHRNALSQLAKDTGMRMDYVDHLLANGSWGRNVLAKNLTDGIQYGKKDSRFLVRAVNGEVRGVLSDSFKRIDARPIADMLIGEAQKSGAIVVDGTASDVRTELKFIVPKIFEPAPGELMVYGFGWGTSDYGCGANWMRKFALRLACFNGMTTEQALRQVHLGRRLSDNIEWSEQTKIADTKLAMLEARDTARTLFSVDSVRKMDALIAKAHADKIDPRVVLASLKKKVGKGQSEAIATAFNSPDVVELPAGNTMWRFSNAISLVARDEKNADAKLDLEHLAGDVLKA